MAKKTKEQIETEEFMKIFFKDAIPSNTWDDEETISVDRKKYPQCQKSYKVDGYNEKYRIVWEHDGATHYAIRINIEKDKKRDKYFISEGYKFVVIPFFCRFTRTLACYYLKEVFDKINKNFEEALTNNYENAANKAYRTCFPKIGWYGSRNTPLMFPEEGKKRFFKEFDKLPEEAQHQIMHSLKVGGTTCEGNSYKPILERVRKSTLNNPLNKGIVEKIRNFKANPEYIKNWNLG